MQALLDAIAAMPLPGDAQRIFHGRGGRHPGCEQWVLDAYPPVFVLTSFAPVGDAQLAAAGAALQARWDVLAPGRPLDWVFQHRGAGQAETRLMAGSVPEPHVVTEAGARYLVHVLRGQNHGLFLDMAEGRRWVREFAAAFSAREGRGARVLNLFAYTCAFSVAALLGGAAHAVNIDMARGALATGQQNHRLNGIASGAGVLPPGRPKAKTAPLGGSGPREAGERGGNFLAHDIFSSWGKITRGGPYDLVIIDPPSYQKGSFVATKDYARILRRLPALLADGGHALLCLNAPELGMDFLRRQVSEQAPDLAFVQRVANPAAFADVDEDRALKVAVFRKGA
ncbi:MAG: class I SAM-dependent methyltransferase [Ottowia sp.]|uniref:class I SAM-dependent methyltransferase n=1 Tax=Ottowia sp. TaxID=1898956 RepID=UPI0039E22E67